MMPETRRGFAGMNPTARREAASKGGRVTQERKKAKLFDSETGKEAGRKGGKASRGGRVAVLEPNRIGKQ